MLCVCVVVWLCVCCVCMCVCVCVCVGVCVLCVCIRACVCVCVCGHVSEDSLASCSRGSYCQLSARDPSCIPEASQFKSISYPTHITGVM